MQTKQNSIDNFKRYIDDLINANLVLFEKKLTDLMRSISSSELLFSLFEYCTSDFDYKNTFNESFQRGDGYGKGRFILPTQPKNQIALIFSLLYQINMHDINMFNLLDNYFFVNTYDESYRNFVLQVLTPFRSEVLRVAETMAEDESASVADLSKPAKAPVIKSMKIEDANAIIKLLDESRSVILQYKIDVTLKKELVDLYQNFKDSLFEGENSKIRIAYLGYKYATLYHRKLDKTMLKIEKLLKDNQVL